MSEQERLEQWIRDSTPEFAKRLRSGDPNLSTALLRKLEAEDEGSDQAWKAHIREAYGREPIWAVPGS